MISNITATVKYSRCTGRELQNFTKKTLRRAWMSGVIYNVSKREHQKIITMPLLPKLIYKFNIFPLKILRFFMDISS